MLVLAIVSREALCLTSSALFWEFTAFSKSVGHFPSAFMICPTWSLRLLQLFLLSATHVLDPKHQAQPVFAVHSLHEADNSEHLLATGVATGQVGTAPAIFPTCSELAEQSDLRSSPHFLEDKHHAQPGDAVHSAHVVASLKWHVSSSFVAVLVGATLSAGQTPCAPSIFPTWSLNPAHDPFITSRTHLLDPKHQAQPDVAVHSLHEAACALQLFVSKISVALGHWPCEPASVPTCSALLLQVDLRSSPHLFEDKHQAQPGDAVHSAHVVASLKLQVNCNLRCCAASGGSAGFGHTPSAPLRSPTWSVGVPQEPVLSSMHLPVSKHQAHPEDAVQSPHDVDSVLLHDTFPSARSRSGLVSPAAASGQTPVAPLKFPTWSELPKQAATPSFLHVSLLKHQAHPGEAVHSPHVLVSSHVSALFISSRLIMMFWPECWGQVPSAPWIFPTWSALPAHISWESLPHLFEAKHQAQPGDAVHSSQDVASKKWQISVVAMSVELSFSLLSSFTGLPAEFKQVACEPFSCPTWSFGPLQLTSVSSAHLPDDKHHAQPGEAVHSSQELASKKWQICSALSSVLLFASSEQVAWEPWKFPTWSLGPWHPLWSVSSTHELDDRHHAQPSDEVHAWHESACLLSHVVESMCDSFTVEWPNKTPLFGGAATFSSRVTILESPKSVSFALVSVVHSAGGSFHSRWSVNAGSCCDANLGRPVSMPASSLRSLGVRSNSAVLSRRACLLQSVHHHDQPQPQPHHLQNQPHAHWIPTITPTLTPTPLIWCLFRWPEYHV